MARPDFLVRPAQAGDRERVRALDAAAALEGRSFRGSDAHEESLGSFDARWPASGAPGNRKFYVVTQHEVIVGFASVDLDVSPRPLLTRIHVSAAARRLGAGAALMRHVVAETSSSLDALSLPGDRETKNLYERQAMKARLIIATTGL